ncbi:MAG TPA: hypothetical protein PK867_12580 [Pirellulales bacterium]|nr:hypothetical protein [Pirellulales bacterium]
MTRKEAVLQEIEDLPDEFIGDVLEYIRRLRLQSAIQRSDAAVASEAVLAKDWLLSEEDEAWRDL